VNSRTKQVETLLEVIEDMDPKLKALGIVEVEGEMTYAADAEGAKNV
jgi:hypothetical protein